MVDRPLAALRGRPGYGAPLASSAGRLVEEALQFMKRQPVIVVAMIPIVVLIVAACVAPWLPIADPNRGDILKRFLPPGAEGHVLITDIDPRFLANSGRTTNLEVRRHDVGTDPLPETKADVSTVQNEPSFPMEVTLLVTGSISTALIEVPFEPETIATKRPPTMESLSRPDS